MAHEIIVPGLGLVSVEVETGKPIPLRNSRGRGPFALCYETLPQMEAGDSFFFPADRREVLLMQAAVSKATRRLKIGAVTRTVPGGVRVWRTTEKGEVR